MSDAEVIELLKELIERTKAMNKAWIDALESCVDQTKAPS